MTKPANKARAEIALPEAGEGAFLRFDIDALERLEGEYGDDYLDTVIAGMTKGKVSVYRTCVEVALGGGEAKGMPWDLPLEVLQARILDALYLTIHGRSYAEQQAHEDELFEKRMKEAETNPRMAAFLSSSLAAGRDTGQASSPKKSAG